MATHQAQNDAFDTIPYTLHSIQVALNRYIRDALAGSSCVSLSELRVMEVVHDFPLCDQRFVAAQLDQTEASISRLAAKLVDQELLERRPDPADKRRYGLILTNTGHNELRRARNVLHDSTANVFLGYGRSSLSAALAHLTEMETYLTTVRGRTSHK